MAKNKEKPDLNTIDAESIIHSFRTTDHLQMSKDKGKETPSPAEPEETDVPETKPVASVQEPVAVPATPETPKEKEETRRRRGKTPDYDYESLFIREAGGITAREGKTVYIRKKYHDRIQKIVRVIGGNHLSLFSYLDNVLEQHFAAFKEEIDTLYKQRDEGVFDE